MSEIYAKKNINMNENEDKLVSKIIMLQILMSMLSDLFATIFSLVFGMDASNIYGLCWIIRGIIYIPLIKILLKKALGMCIASYIICGIVICCNMLLHITNVSKILTTITPLVVYCIPTFIGIYVIKNINIFEEQVRKFGYYLYSIGIIHSLIYSILVKNKLVDNPYTMRLAVDLGFSIVILIYISLKEEKNKNMILIILGMIFLLIIGSRNPWISIVSFPIMYLILILWRYNKKNTFKLLIIIGISLIGILFIFYNKDKFFAYFTSKFGYSRTLDLFFYSDGIHLSGRNIKIEMILNQLNQRPILGLGIGGDSIVDNGTYAHNFLIQIVSNFGYPIGIILIILIGVLCFKGLFINKSYVNLGLVILFFSTSILPMLVDFSIWTKIQFWILLSLCIRRNNIIKGDEQWI